VTDDPLRPPRGDEPVAEADAAGPGAPALGESTPVDAGWESVGSPGAEATLPPPIEGGAPVPPYPTSGTVSGEPAMAIDSPDEPLLPASIDDDELRAAAGARPRRPEPDDDDDDDDDDQLADPRRRKLVMVAAVTGAVGLVVAAFVLFGTLNKQHLAIACEPDQIIAVQGRGFPPWGTRALDDAMWKPIKIPPEAECRERQTEDEHELSGWYLEMLEDRANVLLASRDVTQTDEAAVLLEQALLHARPPERRDQRAKIERLLGDVQYWRASAKLRDATGALVEAARQFDAAAAQRPRHVSDASAWAEHARRLAEELRSGPGGATSTVFPPAPAPGERPSAPPGVALPIEPEPPIDPDPVTPADAGIPTGGVLL
jgi:hypothetical protein